MKRGFTLAEVLITLGIIGVVAAITIPNLMTHFQQEQTVTKLKKAYSVINQAYKSSFDEVGEPENAFTIGSDEYFKTYWAPYIKVLSYCKTPEGCGYKSNGPFKFVNGKQDGTALIMPNARTTFYTMDGTVYIIATGGNNAGTMVPVHWIVVDINGGKGPNRWGRDVFWLKRVPDGGGVQFECYNDSNINVENGCLKSHQARCCAEKIRRAGWKIEKNYPWK